MKTAATLLILATLASGATAFGATNYFKQPYEAVYEISSPTGKTTMKQLSDGKGHMRQETNSNGQKTTSILDFPGQACVTIVHGQRLVMRSAMKPQDQAAADPTKMKPTAKSIGTKVIDSHPCHGFETKEGKIVSDVWLGDDIQNLVRSETTAPEGKTVMTLKSYSPKAPPGDLLAIPAGYKEMKLPNVAKIR